LFGAGKTLCPALRQALNVSPQPLTHNKYINIILIKPKQIVFCIKNIFMATKKKHGGARVGAGRTPATDPKEAVFIYIPASEVKAFGGKPAVKTFAEAAVKRNATRLQK
jgi:hypothetical protein